MKYSLRAPCDQCPFNAPSRFAYQRLTDFASGEFACHKACEVDEESGDFVARSDKTPHCAGALIFLEKKDAPHQMMRICERLGLYDRSQLDMSARVVSSRKDCVPPRDGARERVAKSKSRQGPCK